jgi:hypothetical protein
MRPMRAEIAGNSGRECSCSVEIRRDWKADRTCPHPAIGVLASPRHGFLSAFVRRRGACLTLVNLSRQQALAQDLRRQQHLPDVFAVLNRMMGRGGFVEWEDPSDLGLDRALSRRLIS